MHHEDLYIETPEVEEALRRLPQDVLEARARRILVRSLCFAGQRELLILLLLIQRASDLVVKKQILPKEEWTPVDQKPYLSEILDEVIREREERIRLDNR